MRVSPTQYAHALLQLYAETPQAEWSALSQRFLQHLYRKGGLKALPEIVRLVERLEYAQHGTTPVTVTSAHALDQDTIQQVMQSLMPDRKTEVRTNVDDALIGGIRVETLDSRWDLSVSGQLKQLKAALTQS